MRTVLITTLLVLTAAAPAGADTFAVDDTGDADLTTCAAAANDCTLRGAIERANATEDADTITLPAGRIQVATPLPQITTGDLTIRGVSARESTIDGTGSVGTLLFAGGNSLPDVTVEDLRVTGARRKPFSNEGAIEFAKRIERVAVVDNDSIGIVGDGSGTVILDSLVAGNTGDGVGGVEGQGALTLRNSTVTGNTATPLAENQGPLALGGGVVTVGGINDVDHSTITGNGVEPGVVLLTGANLGSVAVINPSLTVRSSVIGGSGAPNCGGPIESRGHNVDSDGTCGFAAPGDRSGVDPMLAALADNGGPTDTMALLPASPAIDAGDDCPAADQRGQSRAQGATCDAGAFESPFTAPAGSPGPGDPPGTPGTPPPDTTPPKLQISGVHGTVSRRALRKGLKVRIGADEPIAAEVALLVAPHRVTIARASRLVLAAKSLPRAAGTRTVTLKPAHQPAGRRALKAQLRVVAFDGGGNRAVKTVRFTIK
jgi:hypothetical protein